ncbi:HhH-GPD family protein [Rhodopirellula maiorica SM1]|uniref:DNA-3-methyladenine glycosylase II n=1 Tax=Rhodopirellula maiorica SM1 TaxID=1265738 RepID=M5S8Q1_9BACT|nr:DNA-3-methyladenine glycosylase [Rhodopirellula maiorica]EMI22554.1 HhH-GPD family protein [Rhodopirellula maiorica SM1]
MNRTKPRTFTSRTLKRYCRDLAAIEPVFGQIIDRDGYPPMWRRDPSFETLARIILEQQVSLASAQTTFTRLTQQLGSITAKSIQFARDEVLRGCGVSRQKARYLRELAAAVQGKTLVLEELPRMADDEVRESLTAVIGIGHWSASVYLMLALNRTDLFPLGDVALINSMLHEFALQPTSETKRTPPTPLEVAELEARVQRWSPNRTIAAYMLWHAYIQRKGIAVFA